MPAAPPEPTNKSGTPRFFSAGSGPRENSGSSSPLDGGTSSPYPTLGLLVPAEEEEGLSGFLLSSDEAK
ncbi:hypothetical protein AMECASPLE_032517 [Ameca splendens]|uniref:Uncharacterized protein n=1 Tax=Ameca splendens TaxID=208324 RepID=A0ABV0ZH93_9TELE